MISPLPLSVKNHFGSLQSLLTWLPKFSPLSVFISLNAFCSGHVYLFLASTFLPTVKLLLLGPRQSGKTTLTQLLIPKRTYFSFDNPTYYDIAKTDPTGFIESLPDKVTLDEIQRVPELLLAIKQSVDQNRQPGKFLLTGSANLRMLPLIADSLAGRMEIVQLNPLTESEKEKKPGNFLKHLLNQTIPLKLSGAKKLPHITLAERLIAGGYPESLLRTPTRARHWHRQYLKALLEKDALDIAKVKDTQNLVQLIELIALRSGELLNTSNLAQDLGLNRNTIDHYIAILERLFLIRRLLPWHQNAAKRLIKTPKVYLLDSGLAATLSNLHSDDWIQNRPKMGPLLETFVVQQLIAQSEWTAPELQFWHYRNKDQTEVDLVITQGSKTWGIEVKAGERLTSSDGKGLKRLADQCKPNFEYGIILHTGNEVFSISKEILAVPISKLWEL